VGAAFARAVEAAIADIREKDIKPAALLVDTIFSSSGVFTDPAVRALSASPRSARGSRARAHA